MPWSETTKMRERMRFVLDAEEGLFTMTELCERYGISRVTGHKWLKRFRRSGLSGLRDRSSSARSLSPSDAGAGCGASCGCSTAASVLGRS